MTVYGIHVIYPTLTVPPRSTVLAAMRKHLNLELDLKYRKATNEDVKRYCKNTSFSYFRIFHNNDLYGQFEYPPQYDDDGFEH